MNKTKIINLTNGVITKEILEKIDNMDAVKNASEDGDNIILQLGKDTKLPDDCSWLFYNKKYNQIIFEKGIDTSNVINMSCMFADNLKLNNIIGLENFNTNNVTTMYCMFSNCHCLNNVDISNFNYNKVEDLCWMFVSCHNLSEISGFDKLKDKIKEISWTESHGVLNCTPESIETNYFELTDIYSTFGIEIEPDKSNKFDKIITINKGEISNISIQKILTNISENNMAISKDSRLKLRLGENVKLIDTFRSVDEDGIFYNIDDDLKFNIESIEFKPGVDSSIMKDMSNMFNGCRNLKEIKGLENLETKNVTDMGDMFSYCFKLQSLNLSNFNTSNVTNMEFMFNDCRSLESLDLSSFDTSNVTNMKYMFEWCSGLQSLDLNNFDTSNVKCVADMFKNCKNLKNLDISNFNYQNIEDLDTILSGCINLYDVNGFEKLSNKADELNALDPFENCDRLLAEKIDINVSNL